MFNDTHKLVKEIEAKSLDDAICSWNLNRIFIIAILSIIFQLANLLNPRIYCSAIQLLSVYILLGLNLLLLLLLIVINLCNIAETLFKKRLYLAFWAVFPLTLTSFYIYDILYNRFPVNLFIMLMLVAAYPILSKKETAFIFSIPLLLNIVLFIIYKPTPLFIIYSFVGMTSAAFISATIHGKYMDLLIELSNACTYDSLSGILNKQCGYERAANMLEGCKKNQSSFCAYMLDIDYFKEYNDTYGHQAGDHALKSVADCINNCFPKDHSIVCRFGGEEFLICCTMESDEDFAALAETLLDNIYNLRLEAGCKRTAPYVTASIGYTIYHPDINPSMNVTLDSVIKIADNALYKAKSLGRNQCYKF